MKTSRLSGNLRARVISGLCVVGGALAFSAPLSSIGINTAAPGTTVVQPENPPQQAAAPVRFSSGVADILKMVQAKVDPEVVKAYVNTSRVTYNLSATEIIALKNMGVSPEILTAMIQRGGELRGQAAASTAAQPAYPSTAVPYAPAPTYDYGTQLAYPAYTYSYPAYSYAYPDYSYSYPYSSYGYLGLGFGGYYGGFNCGYSWPYCWPSSYWGGFPYRNYCGYGYPYYYGARGCGYYYGNRGYCGYPGSYRYPAYYGNRGYSAYRGYSGYARYSGAYRGGYYSYGARSAPFTGRSVGGRSFGSVSRSASFTGHVGSVGARSVSFGGHSGSFGARSVSFGGHAGGFGGRSGGFGGHGGGRGR